MRTSDSDQYTRYRTIIVIHDFLTVINSVHIPHHGPDQGPIPHVQLSLHSVSKRRLRDPLPDQVTGSMLMSTLSNFAEQVLKRPGHAQALTDEDFPSGSYRPLIRKTSTSTLLETPQSELSQGVRCEGMVDSTFGEPRSLPASTWDPRPRPLSDIRELTEPSLVEEIPQRVSSENSAPNTTSVSRKQSVASRHRLSIDSQVARYREPERKNTPSGNDHGIGSGRHTGTSITSSPPSPEDNSYSSIYSIPRNSVPRRSSSRARTRNALCARQPSPIRPSMPPKQDTLTAPQSRTAPPLPPPPPPPPGYGHTISRRGKSQSPLRQIAARLDAVCHDTQRRIPSQTFIREPLSNELLEFPTHRHPRINLGVDLSAGIFVGGGTIEGTIQIKVSDSDRVRHRKTLDIARISIDLLGLEEMVGHKRSVFLNLAVELIDGDNPPPKNMVDSQELIGSDDLFWHLMPSTTNLPFIMSLPLNVGPPPFQSKNARIRYQLCVSLLIRDQEKQYIVRTSEDVTVLSVYDPEKALVSLPSPLTASDEYVKVRDAKVEIIRLTAGLHRQVWVSGTSIYVDVHIMNNSQKTIKKIELQLERDILCYKHAAAATMEKSASQARIFNSNERSILSKSSIKQGSAGWHGVPAHTTHIRTCDLEVPRGHGTVNCGKYFEVRYFLNVVVSITRTKTIAVQLPIVLIHMNSLDVVPNSVAQVAAAIEEKRTAHGYTRARSSPRLGRRPSRSVQGRAFAAPRMQSLDRMRTEAEDLQQLGEILDKSPRKSLRRMNSNWTIAHRPVTDKAVPWMERWQVSKGSFDKFGPGRRSSIENPQRMFGTEVLREANG
ncbi:hypothetical protein GQ43DRAFT_473928 [Delitschia confertaspora ATCC 74209]|uniref:Arrestin C-terminal-like domain-containing protein n=1 Tax=Delitschia confertaspora ATCC 74209 TaxID=1513339 RepID=A0A9P4JIX0_9PLEO|nr:hypothetical protein GQ43DRAFT_473928 [Delitschia confertaspora ATCC 74209]